MSKILASVILYNPDINQLRYCTKSIFPNVDQIRFVDNASKNHSEIENLVNSISNATILWNKENQGLSKAFNALIQYAKENRFTHLLLLDQDSEPAENFIEEYKKRINDNYACLVPFLTKKGFSQNIPKQKDQVVQTSINSGTLININALPQDIRFDEHLFVDWIDIDFFYQLYIAKKNILQVNTTHLQTNIGNKKEHHFFSHIWYSYNYSTFRLRKQAQDSVYFFFKHRQHPQLTKEHIVPTLWRWFMILLFEKHKIKKFYAITTGLIQGVFALKNFSHKKNASTQL